MTRGWGGILLVVAAGVVGAAAVAAISVLGTPAAQRQERLDVARVADLAAIERSIDRFVAVHKKLPADLAAMMQESGFSARKEDPQTGAPYEYQVVDEGSYRLCAVFATSSALEASWAHGIGRQCFIKSAPIP